MGSTVSDDVLDSLQIIAILLRKRFVYFGFEDLLHLERSLRFLLVSDRTCGSGFEPGDVSDQVLVVDVRSDDGHSIRVY